MTVAEAWNYLVEHGIASEETLHVVTDINGYSIETLEDVLFAQTAERNFDDLEDK